MHLNRIDGDPDNAHLSLDVPHWFCYQDIIFRRYGAWCSICPCQIRSVIRTHPLGLAEHGIYLICLLVSLPAIAYRPNAYLYSMALLSPLIGLLILNSKRCRELRHTMLEIRHKREAIIATLKKQGRWKWW